MEEFHQKRIGGIAVLFIAKHNLLWTRLVTMLIITRLKENYFHKKNLGFNLSIHC